jgi:DNA invertase Pin-like site-specific DNA recombinase
MTQSTSTKLFYANKAGKKRTRVHVTEQFYTDVKTMTNMIDTTALTSTNIARIFNCGIATVSRIKLAKDYADYIVIVQRDSQWATKKAQRKQVELEKVNQDNWATPLIGM